MRMINEYEVGRIAVDAVIFTVKDRELWVYLKTREKEPFLGQHELPGGLLLPRETAENTLARKLNEIVDSDTVFLEQFHTFTDPKRDPRTRTISIAFMALLPQEKVSDSLDHFHKLTKLPQLAFDHKQIVDKAHLYLRTKPNYVFARQFLPQYFPLNQLQTVYEAIAQRKLDNRNFRKKMLDSGLITKVAKVQSNVRHRPATLFRFSAQKV